MLPLHDSGVGARGSSLPGCGRRMITVNARAWIAFAISLLHTESPHGLMNGEPAGAAQVLYLAHFAGDAGAVAILSALDGADAASVIASADPTGRTKREKIVKSNPFLERFTIADLRSWADRRMREGV